MQLNKRHGFLDSARAVLDLCAAPGGWLQVAVKTLPLSARIVGVDLVAIRPVRGATTFVGDITTAACRERLRRESGGSLFDVVLHDGAPNVGGVFSSEQYTQSALVLDATKLAAEFLAPSGTFVTKVRGAVRGAVHMPTQTLVSALESNLTSARNRARRAMESATASGVGSPKVPCGRALAARSVT